MSADTMSTVVGIVAVVNPIGAIPSFLALTEPLDSREFAFGWVVEAWLRHRTLLRYAPKVIWPSQNVKDAGAWRERVPGRRPVASACPQTNDLRKAKFGLPKACSRPKAKVQSA